MATNKRINSWLKNSYQTHGEGNTFDRDDKKVKSDMLAPKIVGNKSGGGKGKESGAAVPADGKTVMAKGLMQKRK